MGSQDPQDRQERFRVIVYSASDKEAIMEIGPLRSHLAAEKIVDRLIGNLKYLTTSFKRPGKITIEEFYSGA